MRTFLLPLAVLSCLSAPFASAGYKVASPAVRVRVVSADGKPVPGVGIERSVVAYVRTYSRSTEPFPVPIPRIPTLPYWQLTRFSPDWTGVTDANGEANVPPTVAESGSRKVKNAAIQVSATKKIAVCQNRWISFHFFSACELKIDGKSPSNEGLLLECRMTLSSDEVRAGVEERLADCAQTDAGR